jgi:3-isopropylmalate/(R)-2-methylmalate dehydratase small subunit
MIAPILEHTGTAALVPGDDIDTDRIIPARFLMCVTFDDLGPHLLHDERFGADGSTKGHPLDAPSAKGASVLITGNNFGCGSSREHAPQALFRAGFRAVIAGSFAEIFFANALAIGLPCVALDPAGLTILTDLIGREPHTAVRVHTSGLIEAGSLRLQGRVPPAAAQALREGRWDPLSELHERMTHVRESSTKLPYLTW